LRDVFVKADQAGANQMLSNSDPTNYVNDLFFDELYQGFTIERILASRRINSKGNSRGEIREIIVTNY
ncbi:MAG: DNA adenine methylase, partial [Moorea sp. SIO4A5]|nr:DNA adenine methylase [Moorena sp. SIO4A5]